MRAAGELENRVLRRVAPASQRNRQAVAGWILKSRAARREGMM
jgi:hypothetical protein